jgi:uncharacterized membrane protein YbhN (UPF0104 family)
VLFLEGRTMDCIGKLKVYKRNLVILSFLTICVLIIFLKGDISPQKALYFLSGLLTALFFLLVEYILLLNDSDLLKERRKYFFILQKKHFKDFIFITLFVLLLGAVQLYFQNNFQDRNT